MGTILGRTTLSFLAFVCLLGAILGTTMYVTNQQQDDGLIVNLSGRQRMLSQKMTKEVLIYYTQAKEGSITGQRIWEKQLRSTMKVFDVTLMALKDGGAAPLDLKMEEYRVTPPASNEEIRQQLETVVSLWLPIKRKISRVLESKGEDEAAVKFVIDNNGELLNNMNKAVFLMQYDAERKVKLMVKSQMVAIGLGLIIIVLSLFALKRSVVRPIKALIEAAESMSKGDLKTEIRSAGMQEVSDLASSLNRMRVSLLKMMDLVNVR